MRLDLDAREIAFERTVDLAAQVIAYDSHRVLAIVNLFALACAMAKQLSEFERVAIAQTMIDGATKLKSAPKMNGATVHL